jgi:hypothetical protein
MPELFEYSITFSLITTIVSIKVIFERGTSIRSY